MSIIMTRVVVSSKKNLNTLYDAQIKEVALNQPSIVQIGVNQEDIKSIVKQGNDLVITLKNGEKIIISDFYNNETPTQNTLAIPNDDGTYAIAQFNDSGKFIGYSPVTQLSQFISPQTSIETAAVQDGTEDLGISKAQLIKAGLVALAAEGLYLWSVNDDDDKDNKGNNKPTDIIAPTTPTATLGTDAQTITGKTEAKAKIEVKDATGKVIASGQADDQGNYTVKLDQSLVNGNKVSVIAIDSAGNISKSTVVTGTKDTIAPDAPTAQLNADGTIVTGKAEANAKVSVYDADEKLLGTVTANNEGIYSISLSPSLTSDKGGTVIAEDKAGNKSEPSKIFAGKDTLAPDQPLVEVSKEGNSIRGEAEANAKIQIKDADGKLIGSGVTDSQGHFQITISPALTTTQKGSIVIEDAAGNQSKPLEITAGKDTIAPDKATVALNAAGDSVTGTAEANSKVEIKSSDGKTVYGSGTVGTDGKFTITLSPALTDKTIGKVYVIDTAGNRSDATDVLGIKDTIAPNKPILQTVTDDVGAVKGIIAAGGSTDDSKPVLAGAGEAKAVLTLYDNGQAIGSVTVGDNGKWSFNPNHDFALGNHKITLTQTDAAGNTSEVSDSFSFAVIAPAVTTTLLKSENVESVATQVSLSDHVDLSSLNIDQASVTEPAFAPEQISVNELLQSSDQSISEIDEILNQFASTESSVVTNSGLTSSNQDIIQAAKLVFFDQLELLQHTII